MKKEDTNRTKWIHLRMTPAEMNLLRSRFEKSICPKLSDFARKNLLEKPVVLKYRNQSVDHFIAEISRLRNDLNAAGGNYNQAVRKLHSLEHIPDFKNWILSYEEDKKVLFESIEKIKICVFKMAEKWLQ